mgnify:CR=1 FL=1
MRCAFSMHDPGVRYDKSGMNTSACLIRSTTFVFNITRELQHSQGCLLLLQMQDPKDTMLREYQDEIKRLRALLAVSLLRLLLH